MNIIDSLVPKHPLDDSAIPGVSTGQGGSGFIMQFTLAYVHPGQHKCLVEHLDSGVPLRSNSFRFMKKNNHRWEEVCTKLKRHIDKIGSCDGILLQRTVI